MNINQKAINEIRYMTASIIKNAENGHTGSCVGGTAILYSLFKDHYFYNVNEPEFIARDRFVLSAGHITPLYYAIMNFFNMGIGENDLKNIMKLGYKTPATAEFKTTKGIEVSAGQFGQGVAHAVGMAIGQTILGEKFNAQKYNIIDGHTFCYASDGDIQEGVAMEACSLAGTLKLNKLILLYDCNKTTADGSLKLSSNECISKKFKAMKWNVIEEPFGNSYFFCTKSIAKAKKSSKPTIIIFNTDIGFGTSYAKTSKVHDIFLNEKELIEYKKDLLIDEEEIFSKDVKEISERTNRKNKIEIEKWNRKIALYETTHPDLYKQFKAFLTDKQFDISKCFKAEFFLDNVSTTEANSAVLNELAQKMPRFIGGSADLSSLTKTIIKCGGDYSSNNKRGRNIFFGTREQCMGAICNGISIYLKTPVFCSTLLSNSNYMISAIRMSALMNLQVFYMFSHDSFKIGKDGPIFQPVEQLSQLRQIPNLDVYRPADSFELVGCYKLALQRKNPCAFVLSKQPLKQITNGQKNIYRGGYNLSSEKAKVTLLASGSEVELAMNVKEELLKDGIMANVCSFPCLEIFDEQSLQYKKALLGGDELKVVIEASNDNAWYKYVNSNDIVVCINEFGKSASQEELEKYFGFNVKSIIAKIKSKLK